MDVIPGGILSQADWDAVVCTYPRVGLADGTIEKMCVFCREKPSTTLENFVPDFGKAMVDGHSRKPNRFLTALWRRLAGER